MPKAIVALRYLNAVREDLKVDWMKAFVSSDCEAWYMPIAYLCGEEALKNWKTLYTSFLVWEKIMVLGIVDVLVAVDIMCASLPKSRCIKGESYINMYNAILHVVCAQNDHFLISPSLPNFY